MNIDEIAKEISKLSAEDALYISNLCGQTIKNKTFERNALLTQCLLNHGWTKKPIGANSNDQKNRYLTTHGSANVEVNVSGGRICIVNHCNYSERQEMLGQVSFTEYDDFLAFLTRIFTISNGPISKISNGYTKLMRTMVGKNKIKILANRDLITINEDNEVIKFESARYSYSNKITFYEDEKETDDLSKEIAILYDPVKTMYNPDCRCSYILFPNRLVVVTSDISKTRAEFKISERFFISEYKRITKT